jgi:hypothetical protein
MTILFDKDNLYIKKYDDCNYIIQTQITNPRLNIPSLFTFDWLKIIFAIHPEFIEKYEVFQEDENNAKVFVLLRHFFKDFGLPQLFFFVNIRMERSSDKITVYQTNELCLDLITVSKDQLHVPTNESSGCIMIKGSSAFIKANIKFQYFIPPSEFIEKMGLILCTKVIFKTKQFIENL